MIFCNRVSRRVRQRTLLLGTAISLLATPAFAQEGVQASSASAQDGAAARHVDINEYYVEGNTVLSDAEIEQAVYPFLGPGRSLDDVEKARAALQKAYEARGLKTVLVDIPQQNVVGGRVRLSVTEAKVGQVNISGGKHTSNEQVIRALPSIMPGNVPDLNAFTGQLTALNSRSGDRQVTPELKAGVESGTIDVDLKVEDKLPLHGGIELSNRFSRDTRPLRLQANLRYDDLWGWGHSISGFYSVAPQRRSDAEVFVGSYGMPLSDRLRLDVTGLVSNSNVATVGGTTVLGDGYSVTATFSRTLGGPAGLYQRVTAAIAYKDFKEAVTLGSQTDRVPITYFPISLGYAGSWTTEQGTLGFDLTGTFAFRGLGSNTSEFDYKRYRATGGFAYLHGGLNYLYDLPHGAQLYSSLEGQLASEPLISNEQISIGGAGSIRGYLQSEAIGDKGFMSSVELRSPSLSSLLGRNIDELRVLAFVDAGRVWILNPLPEQVSSYGLISVGGGVRLKLFGHFTGNLDIGFPLKDNGATKSGDTRIHFSVSTDF